MSNGKSSTNYGGLLFATLVGALGTATAIWFGLAWHYGEKRKEIASQMVATADWAPKRVARADATEACMASNLRQEAERQLHGISAFDTSKIDAFVSSPTRQRGREMQHTLEGLAPATKAFVAAYTCNDVGRLPRLATDQSLSGPTLASAIGIQAWNDESLLPELRKVVWVGRDVQASAGLYEFMEGARIMSAAYDYLLLQLPTGALDNQAGLAAELDLLIANEESAQRHWRAGSRVLLSDLLGPDWDANPPTPMRARSMMDGMERVLVSLDEMPSSPDEPFQARRAEMEAWNEKVEMHTWDAKFSGYETAGLEADALATAAHAKGRALRVGLALRDYRRKRGSCPRALDELPGLTDLAVVPVDPFTNAPFEYDARACSLTVGAPPKGAKAVVKAIP